MRLTKAGFNLVTVWRLGLVNPASGTWASVVPAGVIAVLGALFAAGVPIYGTLVLNVLLTVLILLFSWATVHYGDAAEARFGKDPSAVVSDEVAGQSIALLFLPVAMLTPAGLAVAVLVSFLAFRFFDILKVEPAGTAQHAPGGWGILMDDIIAGVYAWFVTQTFVWLVLV